MPGPGPPPAEFTTARPDLGPPRHRFVAVSAVRWARLGDKQLSLAWPGHGGKN